MKKFLLAAVLTLYSGSAFACFPVPCGVFLSTEDINAGILCKVKDVTVLAASAEDCAKIGGEATHQVTTTKTPVK